MKMRFTSDWLRRRIEHDEDVDTDAGLPIVNPEVLQVFMPEKVPCERIKTTESVPRSRWMLGMLLRQLRRRDRLDISHLAALVRVPEDELRSIEQDQSFMPKPRTLHQLATYFKISPRAVIKLSAAVTERDPELDEVAVRFAASSDALSKLSREERDQLNQFVKYLSEYKGGARGHGKD